MLEVGGHAGQGLLIILRAPVRLGQREHREELGIPRHDRSDPLQVLSLTCHLLLEGEGRAREVRGHGAVLLRGDAGVHGEKRRDEHGEDREGGGRRDLDGERDARPGQPQRRHGIRVERVAVPRSGTWTAVERVPELSQTLTVWSPGGTSSIRNEPPGPIRANRRVGATMMSPRISE